MFLNFMEVACYMCLSPVLFLLVSSSFVQVRSTPVCLVSWAGVLVGRVEGRVSKGSAVSQLQGKKRFF